MIKATDFTAQNVNSGVINKIIKEIEDTGDTQVDFKGTLILNTVHKNIAEMMVEYNVEVFNVKDNADKDEIAYHKQILVQPVVSSLDEFKEVFKKRFPEGTVCVLDRTIEKGLALNEMKESIIMIEEILENRVRYRHYYQSKVQPIFFRESGGKDSGDLYYISEITFNELYNNDITIDHPRNEDEKKVIDILFSI